MNSILSLSFAIVMLTISIIILALAQRRMIRTIIYILNELSILKEDHDKNRPAN